MKEFTHTNSIEIYNSILPRFYRRYFVLIKHQTEEKCVLHLWGKWLKKCNLQKSVFCFLLKGQGERKERKGGGREEGNGASSKILVSFKIHFPPDSALSH